jgi:hypothetical protein
VAQRLARGAHNSEVTGSKPVAGILVFIQVHSLFKTSNLRGAEEARCKNTVFYLLT